MTEDDITSDNRELLEKLNLIAENGDLKRAAIMTFYRYPEKLTGGSYTKIGYFENDADLLYQDEIHGSLLYQAEQVYGLALHEIFKSENYLRKYHTY